MPDININLDYFEHRKTKRTVGLLGRGADLLPIKLWRFCGKFHPDDGQLIGYSEQEIESACDWWGEKGKMVEVFLAIVWLEKIEGGFQVHDWLEHQGHLKSYKKRAKAAAEARWSRMDDATSIASSIPQAMLKKPPSNASSSTVSLSKVPVGEVGCGEKPQDPPFLPPEPPPDLQAQRKIELGTKARVAIHWLNQEAGRRYLEVEASLVPIMARLAECDGDIDGVKKMITRQVTLWKGDQKSEEWLNPATLFRKHKFHEYYANRDIIVAKVNGNGNHAPAQPAWKILQELEGKVSKLRDDLKFTPDAQKEKVRSDIADTQRRITQLKGELA